VQVFEPGNTRH